MSVDNPPRYGFYERVIVSAPGKPIHGRLGAVLGRAPRHDGEWGYAVHIYETETSWALSEEELLPTGEFDVEETFHDGTTVEVEVDNAGRGRVRNPPGSG